LALSPRRQAILRQVEDRKDKPVSSLPLLVFQQFRKEITMSKFIAWLKSLFTKGKSDMTDVVAQAAAVAAPVVATVEAAATQVAGVVAADATALVDGAKTDIEAVVSEFEGAAAKIKAVYDKLGIDLHAWDEIVALAKAL
jgi:hypothetical protein